LRLIGVIEGTSTLVLFGIAMPLKYIADEPMAVRVVGLIHGLLFIGYCAVLHRTWTLLERPLPWAIKFFVASIFPFGPFIADRGLKREMAELPPDGDRG
jgi:integral membrane protein